MKKNLLLVSTSCLLLAVGCGDSAKAPASAPASTPAPSTVPAAPAANVPPTPSAPPVSSAVPPSPPAPALPAAVTQAQEAAQSGLSKVQEIIANARALAGQQKWAESIAALEQLASVKLSPEESALVENVRRQAKEQMAKLATEKGAAEAAKAVGNLLNPNK